MKIKRVIVYYTNDTYASYLSLEAGILETITGRNTHQEYPKTPKKERL
jgi:hypothetical protein